MASFAPARARVQLGTSGTGGHAVTHRPFHDLAQLRRFLRNESVGSLAPGDLPDRRERASLAEGFERGEVELETREARGVALAADDLLGRPSERARASRVSDDDQDKRPRAKPLAPRAAPVEL